MIQFSLLENQEMRMLQIRKTFPLVELLVELSLTQTVSVQQVRTGGLMLLIAVLKSLVVFKHMISFFNAVLPFSVDVKFFLLSLFIASGTSGLETVEIYRRVPVACMYSELSSKFSVLSSFF
ncbi:hypothetical protein NPIL_181231 [Nephila pilipes]|uniref:Uncharacterized protein n=1 Tax=Nephila pilipes TaxID=299642 RepID=A0A8X6NFZ5_NEPPI|nr:hypothetical protein NPIL_181231 [Nephila pilipes]